MGDIVLIGKDEREVAVGWRPGEDTPKVETNEESGCRPAAKSLRAQEIPVK